MRAHVPRRPALGLLAGTALAFAVVPAPAATAAPIPSQTIVRCFGIGTAGMRSCQVGVWAEVPAGAPLPTGTISWVSSGPGSETVTTSCVPLPYHPSWGPPFPNVIWCDNGYLSPGETAPRTETVVATYSGDERYAGSTGTTEYYVRDPNGTIPEATAPAVPAWRPEPAGDKDRPTTGGSGASAVPAVLSALVASRTGLTLASTGPAASVVRIERRVLARRADGRAVRSWRTVRRLRRTLAGGTNRIAVRLRPGVHRVTIGGGAVRRTRLTVIVPR